MKKISLLAILGLVAATGANANTKMYVSGGLGLGMNNTFVGSGEEQTRFRTNNFGIDGAVGVRMGDVRAELAVSRDFRADGKKETVEYDDGFTAYDYDVQNSSAMTGYMLNAYYDISAAKFGKFVPFVGAGVGMRSVTGITEVDGEQDEPGTNTLGFAYDLKLGVTFEATEELNIDLGYSIGQTRGRLITEEYDDFADEDVRHNQHFRLNTNAFRLGARYAF